jgi:hypothetical protein
MFHKLLGNTLYHHECPELQCALPMWQRQKKQALLRCSIARTEIVDAWTHAIGFSTTRSRHP